MKTQVRDTLAVAAVLVTMFTQMGCNDGPGESVSDTATTETLPPEVNPVCASPQFGATEGPGESYLCHGKAEGVFRYNQCGLLNCSEVVNEDIDGDPDDSVPTTGEDYAINFPDDPTEGQVITVPVEACCNPDIENDSDGVENAEAACVSECAHAACSMAIERLKALIADPATDDPCGPLDDCKENVYESLEHFLGRLQDNFGACVALVGDGDPDTIFGMGTPSCSGEVGCLVLGELAVNCTVDAVDFMSNEGSCTEALTQPPVSQRNSCEIDGRVEVTDGSTTIKPDLLNGRAETAYFPCGETYCPFIFQELVTDLDDAIGVYGGGDLLNLSVELYTAAVGRSDGLNFEIPSGAIRVSVSGDYDDGTTIVPFTVVASSTNAITGTHSSTNLLTLNDDIAFEAGSYSFYVQILPVTCTGI